MSIASFFKPGGGGNKRPREEPSAPGADTSAAAPPAPIRTLVAWNANSLLNRIQTDRELVSGFLKQHAPDVLFVSEVRMPAAGPAGCKKGDGKPRRRGAFSTDTPAARREADAVSDFLRAHGYRAYWSLSDSKYAGAGLLVRRACEQPTALRYTLEPDAPAGTHHPDGRVIVATFSEFELLGTYSPNNGTHEASFERRRQWDAQTEALASAPTPSGKPLVWLGDLNVAAAWEDVGPEPRWFREENGKEAEHEGDRGQPGFTRNEQERFARLLEASGLVDAYRHHHPAPDWTVDATWRGTPGSKGPPESGRYYNKGMRIDYVLVGPALRERILRAAVLGGGPMRNGFLGSDHCPLLVELSASGAAAGPTGTASARTGDAE